MMQYYGQYPEIAVASGLLHLLFWIVVIWLVAVLVRGARGQGIWRHRTTEAGTPIKSAMELLKERYVKGEISRLEFEEKKKDIS